MKDPYLAVLEWVIPPTITAMLGGIVYTIRKVGDHAVQFGRLESKMEALANTVKDFSSNQKEYDNHLREMLQRLSRIEETLRHIQARLEPAHQKQPTREH